MVRIHFANGRRCRFDLVWKISVEVDGKLIHEWLCLGNLMDEESGWAVTQ